MDLSSKKTVKEVLKKYNIRPSKKFGQNFLIDKSAIRKVIKATDLKSKDTVLEIGPGIGTLTREIAKRVHPVKPREAGPRPSVKGGVFNRVRKVIAVEKDTKMCEILKETLRDFENIKVINNDILKLQITNYKLFTPHHFLQKSSGGQAKHKLQITKNYKIIANLPFYLTAVVIRKFLESDNPPKEMVLIVQKEVGQRLCAKPSHPIRNQKISNGARMNLLALFVQVYAKPIIIDYISKNSFLPKPKVDSVIIKIIPYVPLVFPTIVENAMQRKKFKELFFKIAEVGFSHPRKQILKNFYDELKLDKSPQILPKAKFGEDKEKIKQWLVKNNIQPSQRAETLSIKQWIDLTKTFNF